MILIPSVKKSNRSFPFSDPSVMEKGEVLINVDNEEPSRWVWVPEEMVMVPSNSEEKSGIDCENYVVVSEEQVVDGVATFMARCILANPKSLDLSPLELQKSLMKTLGGMNKVEKMLNIWHAGKMFYTLATCMRSVFGKFVPRSSHSETCYNWDPPLDQNGSQRLIKRLC